MSARYNGCCKYGNAARLLCYIEEFQNLRVGICNDIGAIHFAERFCRLFTVLKSACDRVHLSGDDQRDKASAESFLRVDKPHFRRL